MACDAYLLTFIKSAYKIKSIQKNVISIKEYNTCLQRTVLKMQTMKSLDILWMISFTPYKKLVGRAVAAKRTSGGREGGFETIPVFAAGCRFPYQGTLFRDMI